MDWSIVEKKFEQDKVKGRKGAFGRVSYVGLNEYIKRLNELFEYQWDFEVLDEQVMDGFVIVCGKLSGGGVAKMQYGTSRLTVSTSSDKMTQVGDDFKSAASDCLKKCASLFGIGLYLYDGDDVSAENGKAKVLKRIAEGEALIAGIGGGDAEALRSKLCPEISAIEEATESELAAYYECLLKEHEILTAESADGADA